MRRTLSLLLCLLFVLPLAACSFGGSEPSAASTSETTDALSASVSESLSASLSASATPPTGSESSSDPTPSEPPTPAVLDIVTDGFTKYRVVRGTDADATIKGAARTLTDALNEKYGTGLVQNDEYVKGEIPDGAREILVGVTNRIISKEMDRTLRLHDFVICTRGYSIAILGGSSAATAAAVDYFIANYLPGGSSLSLSPDLYYRKNASYPYDSFTLDGVALSEYRIVTPATLTKLEKLALSLLQTTVAEQTGVRLVAEKTTTEPTNHEIRFGGTTRHTFDLSATKYAIARDGDHLNIDFLPACSLAAVRGLLADWFATDATNHTTTARTVDTGAINLSAAAAQKVADKKLDTTTQIALTDQLNSYITVIDLANISAACAEDTSATRLWRWQASTSRGNAITAGIDRIDEARLRYDPTTGKLLLLATSSTGGVWVSNYSDGACIWEKNLAGLGPHSIELLPNGYVAVACSGNDNTAAGVIRLYDITTSKYAEVSLPSAHAVLWDPQLEVLWGMGGNKLIGYSVGKDGENKPTLTLLEDFYYTMPIGGGHDLSFVGGDPTCLWVAGSYVYKFNKTTGTFTNMFSGSGYKSIGSLADGTVLYTQANAAGGITHATDTLYVLTPNGNGGYTYKHHVFTGRAIYKARIFHYSYYN